MNLIRRSVLTLPVYFFSQHKKPAVFSETLLKFNFSAAMIPHPEKAHRGGEDAYCGNSEMICVADGVGGWAD